ncbi:GumC family protein [Planctomycetota bacterium]
MDNLQDNVNSSTDPAEENNQDLQDPIIQASDDSSRPKEEAQRTEIISGAKKEISVADATFLPNQFLGTRGGTQAAPSAGEIIESMLRFKWTILVVFVIVAVPAIATIWTQLVPKYQAKAEVRVRPIIPRLVFRTDDNGRIPVYSSFVNTQVSIIRSRTVLERVLEQKEVTETQWYKKPQQSLVERLSGNPTSAIERLKDDLSARPRRQTEIIDISFTNSSIEDAKIIVDAVLEEYIKYIGEKSSADEDKLYSQLKEQYISLQNQIQGQEKTSALLSKSLGTETPKELVSSKRLRLDETQARLDQVRQSIALLDWEMNQAITDDSNDVSADTAGGIQKPPKYYEDEEWRRLDANVRIMRHNITNSLLTPNHPDSARIEKGLEFAEEQLQLRVEQLNEQQRDRLNNPAGVAITSAGASGFSYEEGLKYLKHQMARLKLEEQLLDVELKKQEADFAVLFENAQLLEKENNKLVHKRELFSAVRQRLDQKDMERGAPGSIEMGARAFASSQPYNDRRTVFTIMSLVLALGMGGGLAFLRASRNQAIYTSRDMPYPMQAPFLGYIPVTDTRRSVGKSLALHFEQMQKDQSSMIESIRILRTVLLSRLNGQASTTILVTSSVEGTGKSTFTLMLGESLARSSKKVLLIDADFRKMTLTKQFNLYDQSGFIQSLSCRTPAKYYISKTEKIPGMSFMPAGKRDNKDLAFEEIANETLNTYIDELRNRYNIILLDSPPILPVADAVILSSQVDGTIIVERELVSRRVDIMNALARLDSAGGRVLGTVFLGSSDHEKYGYGYGYHDSKTRKP